MSAPISSQAAPFALIPLNVPEDAPKNEEITIADLPVSVFREIFWYLESMANWKAVSLVCRTFCQITKDMMPPQVRKNCQLFDVYKITYTPINSPESLNLFLHKVERKFANINLNLPLEVRFSPVPNLLTNTAELKAFIEKAYSFYDKKWEADYANDGVFDSIGPPPSISQYFYF